MKTLLLTTGLVLCTSVAVFAQTAETDVAPSASEQSAIPSYTSGTNSIGADRIVGQRFYIGRDGVSQIDDATQADGMAEASGDWDEAGKIGDVLVTSDGSIGAVVVNSGGFLGIGERKVLMPVENLQFVRDNDSEADYFIVYNNDLASFENAPDYDQSIADSEGLLPYGQGGMSDVAAAKAVESATDGAAGSGETEGGDGTESAMATNIGDDTAETGADATPDANADTDTGAVALVVPGEDAVGDGMARPDREAMTGVDATTLTADDLTGARVYGSGDDWIGEVGNLVLAEDGSISEIVIDVGGWLGIAERPVALGFDQLDIRRDGESDLVVYVDATEEELEALPEWEG